MIQTHNKKSIKLTSNLCPVAHVSLREETSYDISTIWTALSGQWRSGQLHIGLMTLWAFCRSQLITSLTEPRKKLSKEFASGGVDD